jgi:hypothetical protein
MSASTEQKELKGIVIVLFSFKVYSLLEVRLPSPIFI